jgi:hypothetical protein
MNQKTAKLINKTVHASVLADPRIMPEDRDKACSTLSRRVRKVYANTPKKMRHAFKEQLRKG